MGSKAWAQTLLLVRSKLICHRTHNGRRAVWTCCAHNISLATNSWGTHFEDAGWPSATAASSVNPNAPRDPESWDALIVALRSTVRATALHASSVQVVYSSDFGFTWCAWGGSREGFAARKLLWVSCVALAVLPGVGDTSHHPFAVSSSQRKKQTPFCFKALPFSSTTPLPFIQQSNPTPCP